MNGKNIVIGGNGDHRMVYASGWRFSDVAVLLAMHATLLALLWLFDDRVGIVSGDRLRCIAASTLWSLLSLTALQVAGQLISLVIF